MTFNDLLVLGAIVVPSLAWVGYFAWKDRAAPEPLTRLGVTYALGATAALAAVGLDGLLQRLFPGIFPLVEPELGGTAFFLYCVLGIGAVEEALKFVPFALVSARFKDFDEPADGIVYGATLGIGFSVYESMLHFEFLEGFERVGRTVTAPLVHGLFAALWGHAVAKFRCAPAAGRNRAAAWVLVAWLTSALVHGAYDFVVLALNPLFRPVSAAIIFGCWLWMARHMRRYADRRAAAASTPRPAD